LYTGLSVLRYEACLSLLGLRSLEARHMIANLLCL